VKPLLALAALAVSASACSGSSSDRGGVTNEPQHVLLTESDNGHVVTLPKGTEITVSLHSTYWTLQPVSGALRADAAASVRPSHCTVAGNGCGTVTETFVASAAGRVQLHAHRNSCGEALRCTGTSGDWRVTVVVQ
jgi:hypothetical protein